MSIRTATLVSLTLAALAAAGAARAEDKDKAKPETPDYTELVKYRQLEMGAIARHFGAVKRIVNGDVDRGADLDGHVAALKDLTRDMVAQYPEGSGPKNYEKTDALPKLWEDPEGFAKAVADFEAALGVLGEAAAKHDLEAAKAAFEKAGDSCGNCHDAYRKDDH